MGVAWVLRVTDQFIFTGCDNGCVKQWHLQSAAVRLIREHANEEREPVTCIDTDADTLRVGYCNRCCSYHQSVACSHCCAGLQSISQ